MTFDEANRLYPYDPTARAEYLDGLDKLRAFADPEWRRMLFELWETTSKRPRPDPKMAVASRAWLDTEGRRE